MIKKLALFLTLVLALTAACAAEAEPWCVQTGNNKPLNVRSGPSRSKGIIASLENGTEVDVLAFTQDGQWAQIAWNGRNGYCMAAYLAQDESADLGYALVYDESLFDFEQTGGVDAYTWKAQESGKPSCYLSVSRLTGYTLEEAMDGLVLQSGVDGERSTITLNGQEVPSYTFSEGADADDRVTQYVCVPRSDGTLLLIELSCYAGVRDTVGRYLEEMLYSMTFSTQDTVSGDVEYVQCPDCGQWFEAGNVFRNHVCPARSQSADSASGDVEYVQCPDCGQWFEAGNVFRNHVCPARSQSADSASGDVEYVQCPDCGQWFEAGNVFRNHVCPARSQSADSASGDVEYVQCEICGEWFQAGNEFRNHQCVTYPSEDNLDEISIVEDYPDA